MSNLVILDQMVRACTYRKNRPLASRLSS